MDIQLMPMPLKISRPRQHKKSSSSLVGFYQDEEPQCCPIKGRLKPNVAPAGTTYIAKVGAQCEIHPQQEHRPTIKTFEFNRYEVSLGVTTYLPKK
jgi:hypothetical protein